jgi:predicted DNA-binding transcriptional regulator AlpA
MISEERLLRVRNVADLLSISVRDVWRKVEERRIPKPIKLGPRVTRWRLSEILAVMSGEWPSNEARGGKP